MPDDSVKSDAPSDNHDDVVDIVLIEDHVILRDGLRSLIELEADFRVVGEANGCAAGLEIVNAARPDLVITDIGLPDRSGLTLIPELKQLDPAIRVLVLTAHCTDEFVRAALESGADGYVLKDATRADLISGIRTVMRGQKYFSNVIVSRVVSNFLNRSGGKSKPESTLTPREIEVLKLIASALSTKDIARKLNLSVKTVEKHRSNLMRKLDLRSSVAVTLYAIRHDYLQPDNPTPE
jgi:DNA-binding NarL/FixJ family response regulator